MLLCYAVNEIVVSKKVPENNLLQDFGENNAIKNTLADLNIRALENAYLKYLSAGNENAVLRFDAIFRRELGQNLHKFMYDASYRQLFIQQIVGVQKTRYTLSFNRFIEEYAEFLIWQKKLLTIYGCKPSPEKISQFIGAIKRGYSHSFSQELYPLLQVWVLASEMQGGRLMLDTYQRFANDRGVRCW
ncbi:hypothetical protein MARGE09_P4078 [Marinagarivorans cellulosilyticus]|uniref:Uncharacterized protein n=1 Tax=Marinagarivorans cellulosilyticus TaxID=2721545 RepID=A0AAN1WLJ8_9GAMM|nr:hypothetical protein MARGE09_P4078 [Marinagarivorans cellulosilyticus]